MNKMLSDYASGKITVADLIEPKILASYAIEDPELRKWLLDTFQELLNQVKCSATDMRRHNLYFIARRYKEALDIIDSNLRARGELP